MTMEGWIWQMSLAGLMPWNGVSPPSNNPAGPQSPPNPLDPREALRLASGLNPQSPNPASLSPAFIDAVTREADARMEAFVRGVKIYQSHPYRRTRALPPSIWQRGAATLRAYGGAPDAAPVLAVPSLINRAYILDFAADRSFMHAAADAGLRPFLLDWGDPDAAEKNFTAEDYVEGVLIPALEHVKALTGQTPRLAGYCLGGTLSLAPAALRPDLVSALLLLAVPWDFQEGTEAARTMMNMSRTFIEISLEAEGVASVDMLQAMFAALDPTLTGRKFRKFAALDPTSDQASSFVELEDWLNDGVPLAGPLAKELLFKWYGAGDPLHGRWKVGDTVIDPRRVTCPTLAVIPSQDRIVPPLSAQRLAGLIPGARSEQVPLGHIGITASAAAPKRVYAPVLNWLKNLPKP
jgi:polyhydroxyalkanoate synthase